MFIQHNEYDVSDNINNLVFRLDFNTYNIAVKVVDWLEANMEKWTGDTRNYIGKYDKELEGPGGYCWFVPFYIRFHNEDDFFKFKMVWG